MAPSVLATDGYKFSMAQAGFPLRTETFYYTHRKGGPHWLPFDVEREVKRLLPDPDAVSDDEERFLRGSGYHMGGAFWAALRGAITVRALPEGSWFFDREPAFTITGPSALVSWLEPLVLQLHMRIQVATLARLSPEALEAAVGTATCASQRELVLETLDAVGVEAPPIHVDTEGYVEHVRERVAGLVDILGDASRIFEVGMRAATSLEQHRLALEGAKLGGLRATSNVLAARELGLAAVGTMGHEHVQRFGADAPAFRAMRDRRPGPASFLLDTWSTVHSGLPAALDLIAEEPGRRDTVRFDSGDLRTQFLLAHAMASERGLTLRAILEDGFDAEKTRTFEGLRRTAGLAAEDVLYGYGGYIVKAPGDPLTRDRVAAVWKLTQSGPTPTMKLGDAGGAGKASLPGRPVLARRFDGTRWGGLVVQEGEDLPEDALDATSADHAARLRFTPDEALRFAAAQGPRPAYSPATRALVDSLSRR